MQMRAAAGIVIVVIGSTLASGCSDSDDSSDDTTTTTSVSQGFEVDTEEGQVSVSLNGDLPPNWPSGFPVPDDAEVAGSGSLADTSRGGLVGVYTSSGSPQDAYDFYKDSSDLTVTNSGSVGVDSNFVGTVQFSGEYTGLATIVTKDDVTYIVVILRPAESGSTTTS